MIRKLELVDGQSRRAYNMCRAIFWVKSHNQDQEKREERLLQKGEWLQHYQSTDDMMFKNKLNPGSKPQ